MLKQLFHIELEAAGDKQKVLSLRIGKQHFAFAIANKSGLELYQLGYYSIEEWNERWWQELIDSNPIFSTSFYEVLVAFDFSESLLVPYKEFKSEEADALLNISYGVNSLSTVISESITGWQLYNIYAIPVEVKDWISQKFPTARFWHQYSLDVRNSLAASAEGNLLVDFRKNEFVVIASGRSHILLTQTFEYTTPEDVLFYLLKICNQFSLSRETVQLQLSGLIDKQSSLYKELYQYFIKIDFRNAQWNTGAEYPAHFFTSLNDLAKCVS
ncbi:MAG: DUF3822 family protein [Chitinophagaceae bacterium]